MQVRGGGWLTWLHHHPGFSRFFEEESKEKRQMGPNSFPSHFAPEKRQAENSTIFLGSLSHRISMIKRYKTKSPHLQGGITQE